MATKQVAVIEQNVSIEAVIQNAIDKGTPVDVMERLLAMRRELKAEQAKEAFDRSMALLQADLPIIKKTKPVIVDGREIYRYEPIEGIVAQSKGPIQSHGFSYSFKQTLREGSVEVICTVTHEMGHSRDTAMEVRLGSKTRLMSDSQQDAAASTFAKRYAFCNAFGILTGDADTDGAELPTRQERPRMPAYQVPRRVPAADDEAGGAVIQMDEDIPPADKEEESNKVMGRGYDYPKMDSTNDSHPLEGLDKPEPPKDTQIILQLLKELGKEWGTPRIAKMNIKMLTGGLREGLSWEVGKNDEDVIEALRKLIKAKLKEENGKK